MTRLYEPYEDENYANVIKNMCTGKIYSDAGEIAGLLNHANVENVKLKLVLGMIIEDLEKCEGNEKYVEWIKSECDVEFRKCKHDRVQLAEDLIYNLEHIKCIKCGRDVDVSYPYYRTDGSKFGRCSHCGTLIEVK